jgi:hypothetical protein
MWNIIWTKVFWAGVFEILSAVVSLALFVLGAWVGIVDHEYAQGAFLLLLSYLGRGK